LERRGRRLPAAFPLACLFVGVPLTTFAESGWSHAVGIGCLCAASAFVFVATIEDD